MFVMIMIVGICCFTLLFLYIQLNNDMKSLHDQIRYTNEEGSEFMLFSTSSNKVMKEIIKDINTIKQEMQNVKRKYLKNEKNIQDMVVNISHDIRTPLTSIQGYVEMLQTSNDQLERERYYHTVVNRLKDLEAMLDEFFLYTKLVNSDVSYTLENKSLYPIVCQTILNYMDVLKAHALIPEIKCNDESIRCDLHEEYVIRICMNLIMNTVRYGDNPFQIEIKKETFVSLVFRNHCAQDTMDVDHMFDRFYKGDQARSQKGSGLGLAIVKELCDRMNANVQATFENHTLLIEIQFQSL